MLATTFCLKSSSSSAVEPSDEGTKLRASFESAVFAPLQRAEVSSSFAVGLMSVMRTPKVRRRRRSDFPPGACSPQSGETLTVGRLAEFGEA
ncbi:MAG TPA: hypothetical protein VNZ85_18095 [Caulobacter sp.]|nr:hypothetical protein [Caulobacter sp.]